jgi:GT2 family glycosyltransferase
MYGEDNDFFCRLRKGGYKIIKTNVPVWHYGEGSGTNRKLSNTWLTYRNAIRFSLKNENIFGIFCRFFSILNQGCNPFRLRELSDPFYRRIRRYNIFINSILIMCSCSWNMVFLPKTVLMRIRDHKVIKKNRELK